MQGSSLQTFTPVPDRKETSSILQTGIVYHAQQGTWVETEPMEINWRLGLSLQAAAWFQQEIFSMYCSSVRDINVCEYSQQTLQQQLPKNWLNEIPCQRQGK